MRDKLPNRRPAITVKVEFQNQQHFLCFGVDKEDQIKEAFCAEDTSKGSEIHAIVTDACILLSRFCLQRGIEIEEVIQALGQDRAEGQTSGPPSSIIGRIAQEVLTLQQEINSNDPSQTPIGKSS